MGEVAGGDVHARGAEGKVRLGRAQRLAVQAGAHRAVRDGAAAVVDGAAVVNPMHDGWIDAALAHLRQEVGRGRVEANLPPRLTDVAVAAMVEHADVGDVEEVQMVAYTGKNVVHGTRAHDEALLDRANISKLAPVQESAASTVGNAR